MKQVVGKSAIEYNEPETWARFRRGDEQALGELAKIYYPVLYGYGRKFSRDTDLVKDCIQDLFLELWDRRAFLGATGSVKFYLLKSLRRRIHRASLKQKNIASSEAVEFDYSLPGDIPIEQAIIAGETNREHTQKLEWYLAKLSRRQQEIIHLHFYEALTHDEVAQIMGISRQAVANLLYRTLKELRGYWRSHVVLMAIVMLLLSFP